MGMTLDYLGVQCHDRVLMTGGQEGQSQKRRRDNTVVEAAAGVICGRSPKPRKAGSPLELKNIKEIESP